jgi:predicted nucleic acid-binding protein
MVEQNTKKEFNDIFIADSIYPEANSIFKIYLKGLEEIKGQCYIVLDTNVLLVPYTTSKESLAQIRKTYETLISESRLIIPVQVAREFAKNRANKLIELYQDLCKKRDENIQLKKGRYPLLEFLDEYQEVIRLEDAIETQLREYRQAIGKVLAHIKGWNWNDPVSLLYAELFKDSVILSPQIDKEEITKDLSKRQQHNIPPGYEDSSKPDKGVGDLLIWHTILEVGKTHKKSVIFVSGEKKPDWWHKKGNDALYPRYELVDEFRRCSEGQSFHIIELSQLLQLYGASETVVEEIRQEEKQIYLEEVEQQSTSINIDSKESVRVTARDETGNPIVNAHILLIRENKTYLSGVTDAKGAVLFEIPKGRLFTVFCSHNNFPAYIAREFEPVIVLEIRLKKAENTGSIICSDGTGYLPNFEGRLNPIRDTSDRLYLYGDNIAIEGGQQQPVSFTLGKPLQLEDCNGKVMQIKIIEVIGRSSLIEFTEPGISGY